jgi:DNA segregation ATPase FtsK/SpoIIIE, S-DNA-T family
MRIKLTLAQAGGAGDDLLVTADGTATVGDLANALFRTDPRRQGAALPPGLTLVASDIASGQRTLAANHTLDEAGLRSGSSISLATGATQYAENVVPSVGTLTVLAGPDSGKAFPVKSGTNVLGRDRSADVRLNDPMVSKFHARVNVTDVVEIVDTNSSNGILVRGDRTSRVVVRPEDIVTAGDTSFSVAVHTNQAVVASSSSTIPFNRSPRLDPHYEGVEFVAPEPPSPPQAGRFPIVPLVAPVVMGSVMFLVTRNPTSVIFVAMSPIMMIGNFFEQRVTGKKAFARASASFRARLADLTKQMDYAAELERRMRQAEHPATQEVSDAVVSLSPMTWTRRPGHQSFLEFRLGLGSLPSRNTVAMPNLANAPVELLQELQAVVDALKTINDVPIVASLRNGGALGIVGPDGLGLPVAIAMLIQAVGLHSPAEVVLTAVASDRSARSWEQLKWLPHTSSEHSPIVGPHLASGPTGCVEIVSQIEALLSDRTEQSGHDSPPTLPAIVFMVADDAPVERARLVSIAERGPAASIFVIWVAASVDRLPAECRTYVSASLDGRSGEIGFVDNGVAVTTTVERSSPEEFARLTARLAPVVDAGVAVDGERDLPSSVSFLQLNGLDLAEHPEAVIEKWRETNSIVPRDGSWLPRRRKDYDLRAVIGQSATGPLSLDLRTQGPHALVGGTTGAGKSEFLQSWILGIAAAHGPDRVTFLLVDYKGGAAFSQCVKLPHTIGLVTDLSPHLVRRALVSLNAELKYREHLLNRKNKTKDLASLERTGDPETPPSLILVVDEFAALVNEVPEFVDGVVNVAQRGRSLGLHLILATQRPAGVIKDNLRANTNLRIALRMADEADALDVIGTTQAASFDPGLPGRGVAKTGPGRITPFQTSYLGGYTSKQPPKPGIVIEELNFGNVVVRTEPVDEASAEVPDLGANDLERSVANIVAAAKQAAVPAPRKPWLPQLSPLYDVANVPTRRLDEELVFGVEDDPENQAQPAVAFHPNDDGNMAIYGTGGSGKSTALRTLAIAAGLSFRGGPCHIYCVDFGSRGLQMLEVLPHVGSIISGDDNERVARLLGMLKETIDERAERYAKVSADSVTRYRLQAKQPLEPRIVLMVDGMGAFRTAYEVSDKSKLFDTFLSIAADGRAVGVHVVVTADRPGAIPAGLASSIQQRLVLRMTGEMDLSILGAPADGFTEGSPPGRGFLEGSEVQVAVFGGSPSTSVQSTEIAKLAVSMERAGVVPAPPIRSLTERVALSELPFETSGLPTLGIEASTLSPTGFVPGGTFVVSGPPGSGRTSVMATLALSLRRWRPNYQLAYFGIGRSPLPGLTDWEWLATGATDCGALAAKLSAELATPRAGDHPIAIFIESIPEFLNGDADYALQDLLKVAKTAEVPVFADGESTGLNGSWPLLQLIKAGRHGLALQPDQMDGDSLFRTPFPRINRRDYPPGRGLYVRGGKSFQLQTALPE